MAAEMDYSREDFAALRNRIVQLHLVTSNRDGLEGLLQLTPLARASAMVEWLLTMASSEQAPATSYQETYERLTLRYKQLWNIYAAYSRLAGEENHRIPDPRQLSPEEQAARTLHQQWMSRLQSTATTLRFAIQLAYQLQMVEMVTSVSQERMIEVVPAKQHFFERDFLRLLKIPDDDASPIREEGGKREQARYELVHHCLDYAAYKQWCRIGNIVYQEKQIKGPDGRMVRTRAYEPVQWPDGNDREDKHDIHEFVTIACSRMLSPENNDRAVLFALTGDVVKYLQDHCRDEPRFPRLKTLRNILSFRNGIYDTREGMAGHFYPYSQIEHCPVLRESTAAAAKYFNQDVDAEACYATMIAGIPGWYHIETPLFQSILDYQNYGRVVKRDQANDDVVERPAKRAALEIARNLKDFADCAEAACVSAQYAETEGNARSELQNVRTNGERFIAKVQTILNDQGLGDAPVTPEVRAPQPPPPEHGGTPAPVEPRLTLGNSLPEEAQRMMYVLIGRLLHDLGDCDTWQILLFIKGRAGTGKSLIAEICMNFFEPHQIGIVANNMEETFGVAQIAEKFMWVCTEVKKNFKMDQSLFQQIVSGENVSAAQKNRDAWTGKWRVPGLMSGNEWASYQDAQGSIARRLAIVNFLYPIHDADSDPQLKQRILTTELGKLILKCNIAYRLTAAANESRDIWKVLPPYFKAQRRALQIDTDPLIAVLHDETIFERHPASYIALKTLDTEYRQRWRQIRGGNFPDNLSEDKLLSALHEIGASKVTEFRPDPVYSQDSRVDTWILGLRSVRDADVAVTSARVSAA